MITLSYNGTATCDDCGAHVSVEIQTNDLSLTDLTEEYVNGMWRHTSSSGIGTAPDLKIIWPDGWIVDTTITCPHCAGGGQEPDEPVGPKGTSDNTQGNTRRTQWERMLGIDYDPEVMCQHIRDLQDSIADSGVFINELGSKSHLTCMRCNKNYPITAVEPGSIFQRYSERAERRKKEKDV